MLCTFRAMARCHARGYGARVDQRNVPNINYAWHALELFAGYGTQEAIVCRDVRLTYADLRERIHAMAAILYGHGIRSTNAVALLVHNPPEGVALQLALHLLGCRTVWIAPNTPERHRADFVHRAQTDVFIYDARNQPQAEIARQVIGASAYQKIFCLGPDGAGPDLLTAPTASPSFGETGEPQAL